MGEQPTHADLCRFLDAQVPFVKSLGISCEEFRPGYAVARWKRDPQWLRPGGYLFGGGLMSLADAALYMAILGQIGLKAMAVTIELKMNFLRPAIGGDVLAQAQVLKVGQRIAYGEVRLFMADAQDKLIAHATCSYAMPDTERR
ncbi:MAG: PaaI family thioesterase [candidate division NC10 bacterium]|nr:PaaI family thioesterase [candidate division NC10 bacterium]